MVGWPGDLFVGRQAGIVVLASSQVPKSARAGCSRQLPGRCAEAGPGAAAAGLAGGPELAAAAGGGM